MTTPLFKVNDDWTFELLEAAWEQIEIIAQEELQVSYYRSTIEVITAEQMLDAYSSVGMPINYAHWSFGKSFIRDEKAYRKGQMNLAYEIVINSDPCIAYLMEENNMMMQTLVMAHACIGHSAVYKNNYLFKQHTDATAILGYLAFAKSYIAMCEERYGVEEVERTLDACHSLSQYGFDKNIRTKRINVEEEERRAIERLEAEESSFDPMWEKIVAKKIKKETKTVEKFPKNPEENILYFIEKNAPLLPSWKREIIRIVRKISQYFLPQYQAKTVHEGFATFSHYYIMTRLQEKGLIDEGTYIEFLQSHTGVIAQPAWNSKYFRGWNPYKLGFEIFMDIKRICENPTDEDKEWFPNLIGKNWVDEVKYAMANFRDESFILQYLSPKLMRDFRMFHVYDNHAWSEMLVLNIHNNTGYSELRANLAKQYDISRMFPNIQVVDVAVAGDRTLTLKHFPIDNIPLQKQAAEATLAYVQELWGFTVKLETIEITDAKPGIKDVTYTAVNS